MANPLGGVGAADMIDIGLKDDFQTWLFSFGTYVRISFECLKLRKLSFILFDIKPHSPIENKDCSPVFWPLLLWPLKTLFVVNSIRAEGRRKI